MKRKLTSREIEVLSLIVNGNTDSEISHTLNMTQRSIEIYKNNLIKVTKVKNIPHLVSWYYTTYFKPNVPLGSDECKELRKKYDTLKKFYEAGKKTFPTEKPMVEENKNVMCQGCVIKSAKIRRLEDELYRWKP